jgi:fermentation-respiration switch protein FrsA (DUF1100 family)
MTMSLTLHAAQTALTAIVAIALIAYGVPVAALYWLQGRLIYPLERLRELPRKSFAPRFEAVHVRTADSLALAARHCAPSRAGAPTVVLFHGNGEDLTQRERIASRLADAGYGVVVASYRGYGGNPGKPREAGLYEDGRAAVRFATRDGARAVLHGYSLGSGIAVQLATEFDIDALILEAPFTRIADVATARFPWLPARMLVRDRYDNVSKIGAVRAPVLIYGGTADSVIPPRQFARLYDAVRAPRRLVTIDRADHADAWDTGGAAAVLAFLDDIECAAAQLA